MAASFWDLTDCCGLATDTVVAMIERQRQDQEHMLKTLTTGTCLS